MPMQKNTYKFYGHERAAAVRAAHEADAAGGRPAHKTGADGAVAASAAHETGADGIAAARYPGIETPLDLYDALSRIWCADTCAPRMRADWTPENKTLGQCSVTAFLAQDIFGGEVRGIPLESGGVHCYNVVDGIIFDLTSEQFGEKAKELDYGDDPQQGVLRPGGQQAPRQNPLQDRESPQHFGKAEKRERYEYLKRALRAR